MKILQVCNKIPYPPHDGGSVAILNLTRSFKQFGHDVTLLAMNTPKHSIDISSKTELEKLTHLHVSDVDTNIKWLPFLINLFFLRTPYIADRFINKNFANTLTNILTSCSFDIIQLEGLYLMPYATVIRKHSQAKIVLRAHNLEYEIWQRVYTGETNWFKKFYLKSLAARLKRFEKGFMNAYDLLVTITERDQNLFNTMGNLQPAFICPSGIDFNDKSNVVSMSAYPSLFFIGSLDWRPNTDGLLWFMASVWPVVLKKFPDQKFKIAGRNAPAWFLKKLNHPNIVFSGEIEDAAEFIRSNAIMIAPCFSGSGMRVKVAEAMAAGKPVVTSALGAEGLPVRHGENIIICESVEDYIKQIGYLLENKEFYEKIGKNALSFAHEYLDNSKIVKELVNFYLAHIP